MTTSTLMPEIVQLFTQIDKKQAQKDLIEILKKIQKGEQWKD